MPEAESIVVHFTVEGEFIVNFCRDYMIEGKEDKAFRVLIESLDGMDAVSANKILEGDATLTGKNSDIEFVIKEDKKYKKRLADQRAYFESKKEREERERLEALYPENDEPSIEEMQQDDLILDGFMKQLDSVPEEDWFKTSDVPPEVHIFNEDEDISHYTWLLTVDGKLYKIPFQQHNEWVKKYKNFVDKETVLVNWVRFSGGPALGMVIDLPNPDEKHPSVLEIRKMMRRFSHEKFMMKVDGTDKFSHDLTYKEANRFLNETYKD